MKRIMYIYYNKVKLIMYTHSIQQVLEGPYTPTTKVSRFDSHSRKFSLAKI